MYEDKVKVLQNSKKLKSINIYIREHFSYDSMKKCSFGKKLWEDVIKYYDQGKTAYLQFCQIVVKDRTEVH